MSSSTASPDPLAAALAAYDRDASGQAAFAGRRLADAVRAHLAASPEIYVALNDGEAKGAKSWVVGAFSTEQRARDACQEDAADVYADPEISDTTLAKDAATPLTWVNDEAADVDGSSYGVVLVLLDVPAG